MSTIIDHAAIGPHVLPIHTWNPQNAAPDDEFDYVDIAAVDRDIKALTGVNRIRAAEAPSRARQIVQPGDVIVSTVRPNLNAVALIPDHLPEAIASTGFCVLRCHPKKLDYRYLFHWVRTNQFVSDMVRQATGASYPAVSDRIVKDSRIPLPLLSEQKRIADILDKADGIRRKRREANRKADELIRSSFFEWFGDPVSNSKGLPTAKLGKEATLDRGRSRHRPRDAAFLYGGPYPFVQTGEIANSDGYIDTFTQTYSEEGLAQSKLWPSGTLCITIAANIAKTAVLNFDACFPDSVVGLVPGPRLTTEFVRYWFVAMEKAIDAAATQVAQKNINLEMLRDLDILLPPARLLERFTQLAFRIRKLTQANHTTSTAVDDLFNSLVQRAFQGAL